MLEIKNITKKYGNKTVLDDVTFTVQDGTVTGFLGPNGAGKSTTMRILLELESANFGEAFIDGRKHNQSGSPMQSVGALLDARAVHPKRSAVNYLRALAYTHRMPQKRVDEVLEIVGLIDVAKKKVKSFSLGMLQRLGIAAALLGNPRNVILDEPINGLDPEGVIWVRNLARTLAAEGRAVLISSHLMSEMAQTADNLVVIGKGKLLAQNSMRGFLESSGVRRTLVRTDKRELLAQKLAAVGVQSTIFEHDGLLVDQLEGPDLAVFALESGVILYEITPQLASLEQVYMQMTNESLEYVSKDFDSSAAATESNPTPPLAVNN
ncbi:ATP-binding cassette domain-containing protein [Canibacter sp. lx-45]|uniref:ATP-binding cassette domain-containing protein n=1 Tax=Canibacter zhuwentaonis TaxID=2837491 RepID=UPI001BDBC63E|nr:ATP-binding cassette domain-containing protein [Canibacter zhuwentaonis]